MTAEELAAPIIKQLQNLLPLPSGCENCWGDLHKGCTDACLRSSDVWLSKRKTISETVTQAIREAVAEGKAEEREEIAQFIETHVVALSRGTILKEKTRPNTSQISLAAAVRNRGEEG